MPNDRLPIVRDAAGQPETITDSGIHQHIGHLARSLHETLRELGLDHALHDTRVQLPDARDRLRYIARVTGESAERVLDGVDGVRAIQEQMTARAAELDSRWRALDMPSGADPETHRLIRATRDYLVAVGTHSDATRAILTDIVIAQDFHDLTGQVIRKVVTLAQDVERQLIALLLDTATPEQRQRIEAEHAAASHHVAGPIMRAEGRNDVVSSQADVDEVLQSLGF